MRNEKRNVCFQLRCGEPLLCLLQQSWNKCLSCSVCWTLLPQCFYLFPRIPWKADLTVRWHPCRVWTNSQGTYNHSCPHDNMPSIQLTSVVECLKVYLLNYCTSAKLLIYSPLLYNFILLLHKTLDTYNDIIEYALQ